MRRMAGIRREDIRVKMPALLHLTRLGYLYTPRESLGRETATNLLPAVLRGAVERINGITLGEAEGDGLLEGLRDLMNRQDQGREFTRALREGWRGLKLLDYGHPERNVFQAAAEVTCTHGRKRFTPDITLYVNGLPLVMIEVKTRDLKDGILAEYDRMRERLRTGDFRPFLQAAQLWVFSNDSEADDGDLIPKKGTFFAAAAGGEFPLREWRQGSFSGARVSARLDPAAETEALRDQGMSEIRTAPGYRRLTSPQTPTHRMMTALLKPERLLFLICYGVQYTRKTEMPGQTVLHRRILDAEQMANLYRMERKIQRGFRNWTIPCVRPGGRITMAAAAIPLLRERIPGCRIFWVCSDRRESLRADAEFRRAGFQPGEIRILSADREMRADKEKKGQGVFFLPESGDRYEAGRQLKNRVRALDREAILIVMGREAPCERAGYTYMLRCADGSLYCGWTTDLKKRLDTHNAGKGARYTRSRRPVELVWWEEHDTKEEAMSREWHIKQMTRQEKERLIREMEEVR